MAFTSERYLKVIWLHGDTEYKLSSIPTYGPLRLHALEEVAQALLPEIPPCLGEDR